MPQRIYDLLEGLVSARYATSKLERIEPLNVRWFDFTLLICGVACSGPLQSGSSLHSRCQPPASKYPEPTGKGSHADREIAATAGVESAGFRAAQDGPT